MRKTWSILLTGALVLGWNGTVRAEEKDAARDILAEAVKALGGQDKLDKTKAATFKEKGTYYGMGAGLPYTGKYALQWPGQFRMEIEGVYTMVLNGDKGWQKTAEGTKEMGEKEVAAEQFSQRAGWIASLLPLKDTAFTLTVVDGIKVNDKPTVGLKVVRKDYPEVKLYFDKETKLLVKSEFKAEAWDLMFKEVQMEVFYGDYKDFDGVKGPTRLIMKRDGKKYVEADVVEYKAEGKLDDKVFAKP